MPKPSSPILCSQAHAFYYRLQLGKWQFHPKISKLLKSHLWFSFFFLIHFTFYLKDAPLKYTQNPTIISTTINSVQAMKNFHLDYSSNFHYGLPTVFYFLHILQREPLKTHNVSCNLFAQNPPVSPILLPINPKSSLWPPRLAQYHF